LGVKSTVELIACFDAAHALVHFPNEEAFGLVVAEALARDLKLFGARLGGIVDIASGVPDAELLGMEDWEGLATAVANWMRNGHPRADDSARLMVERYHPSVIAARHLEIYREVLSKDS
jgi:glycosyltransferase involved in cell wall biosynthesis